MAVGAEVISRRTRASVEHRMAAATRAAPPSRSAAFGNRDDVAAGLAGQHGRDAGRDGGGRKSERQGGTQINRFHLHVRCSLCEPDCNARPVRRIGRRDAKHVRRRRQSGSMPDHAAAAWSMIPKSGYRFSEKIMLKHGAGAG